MLRGKAGRTRAELLLGTQINLLFQLIFRAVVPRQPQYTDSSALSHCRSYATRLSVSALGSGCGWQALVYQRAVATMLAMLCRRRYAGGVEAMHGYGQIFCA